MKRRTRVRGVTLIEQLIVVAIIAIAAGALMAPILAPMEERALAEAELNATAGASLLIARLTQDAHEAVMMEQSEDKKALALMRADGDTTRTLYWIDAGQTLRRAQVSGAVARAVLAGGEVPGTQPGATIANNAVELYAWAQEESTLWHVSARFRTKAAGREIEREMQTWVALGRPWTER